MKNFRTEGKLKIAVYSAFSFWAMVSKQKRKIGGVSRKDQFRTRESVQSHFFFNETDCEAI